MENLMLMKTESLIDEVKSRWETGSSAAQKVFNFFSGRSTFFALVFTTVGCVQEIRGTLSGNFVLLIGAIQALVVLHSAKEDYHEDTAQKETNEHVEQLTQKRDKEVI